MHMNKIRVAPKVVLLLSLLLLCDRTGLVLATLLAAALHECGHLAAARAMKIPLRAMRIDLMGARLEIGGRMISYREEWLLSAAGPIASFFAAAGGSLFWYTGNFAICFSCASLLLGLLNLLPIRSFDGGRMLFCALASHLGVGTVERVMSGCSFFFLFLLWATSVYFLLRAGDGISLFFFSVTLFLRFFDREKL